MKPNALIPCLVLALIALAPTDARAQEEAPVEDKPAESGGRLGSFHVAVETWVAQPAGLQYVPASQADPSNPFATRLLESDHRTHDELRYRLMWTLPKAAGELSLTYYAHNDEAALDGADPGNFVFAELLAPSLFAGVNNDGMADAFESVNQTDLRDWHVDFTRPAFQTTFMRGTWSVGWRRVRHDREQAAAYFATLPGLPALLPPLCDNCPNLDPDPDIAVSSSTFEGRGPRVGADLTFPLWRDKLSLEGGASLSVLRGSTSASYQALTQAYLFAEDPDSLIFLAPPYDLFGWYYNDVANVLCPVINYDTSIDTLCDAAGDSLTAAASKVSKREAILGLQGQSVSTSADVLEGHIGFRWKALPWLEVTGGFRSTRYTNVGTELRAAPELDGATLGSSGQILLTPGTVSREERSATYEGLYAGVIIRLYK